MPFLGMMCNLLMTLGLHPVIHVPNYMDHYSFTDP